MKANSKYKIFISYAHVDNIEIDGSLWVSDVVQDITSLLSQKLGRREYFDIWFDVTSLKGNAHITPSLKDEVRESDIFIMILSQGYLHSSWCLEELKTFLEHNSKENKDSSIFIVQKDNLPPHEKPESIQDILGYNFWYKDTNNVVRTLSKHGFNENQKNDYYSGLGYLVDNLTLYLKSLFIENNEEKSLPYTTTNSKKKIFLAEVSDDLEIRRDEIKRYLEDYGYDVYPKHYLPLDGTQYKNGAKTIMKECELFVQILSHIKGRTPHDLLEGYREAQFNIALELNVPIMQWHSKSLVIDEIEDESHQKLLSSSFVQTIPLVDFKKAVVSKMSQLLVEVKKQEKRLNSFCTELPFIFINATKEDRSIAQTLHSELRDVCIVAQPLYQGSASEIREDLEDNILECHYYILVYSQASVGWVRKQLMQYRKYDRQRKERIRAILIYEGPPKEKEEIGISFPFISVINGRETPSFEKVQQLINKDRT